MSSGDGSKPRSRLVSPDIDHQSTGGGVSDNRDNAHRPSCLSRMIIRIPRELDVFGFSLTHPQFAILLILAFLSLGANGGKEGRLKYLFV